MSWMYCVSLFQILPTLRRFPLCPSILRWIHAIQILAKGKVFAPQWTINITVSARTTGEVLVFYYGYWEMLTSWAKAFFCHWLETFLRFQVCVYLTTKKIRLTIRNLLLVDSVSATGFVPSRFLHRSQRNSAMQLPSGIYGSFVRLSFSPLWSGTLWWSWQVRPDQRRFHLPMRSLVARYLLLTNWRLVL